MRTIWASILPNAPTPIPFDESFFDLGGHSILATRLIFEIRKIFVVEAPLGLIFDQPTITGLASALDALRNPDFGIAYEDAETRPASPAMDGVKASARLNSAIQYGQDYETLVQRLRPSYSPMSEDFKSGAVTVFLTGSTGYLGAFVLRDLLQRLDRVRKVICLVRAPSVEQGVARLREGSGDRGVWDEQWFTSGRLEVVIGDLGLDLFGMGDEVWSRVAAEADVVLHNGALVNYSTFSHACSDILRCVRQVHWVYPYERLRGPNVIGTLTAVELGSTNKQKLLVFVSSTSAIDTEHYVRLSDSLGQSQDSRRGIPEDDDLDGAKVGLKSGYGQSKWVSEKLLFEAGRRGLRGHIVRPGYIVGDSHTAGMEAPLV
jgi:L-aminoadipate-semialdehyde dehydrogenase